MKIINSQQVIWPRCKLNAAFWDDRCDPDIAMGKLMSDYLAESGNGSPRQA